MAPPTKFTDETIEGLRRALANGAPIKYACQYVGITETLYYRWIKRGEEYEGHLADGGKVRVKEDGFLQFVQSMRQAQGTATLSALTRIREAMNGRGVRVVGGKEVSFESDPDWRAAAWYLQHCHPDAFGRGGVGVPVGLPEPAQTSEDEPWDEDADDVAVGVLAVLVDNGLVPAEIGDVIDVRSRLRITASGDQGPADSEADTEDE